MHEFGVTVSNNLPSEMARSMMNPMATGAAIFSPPPPGIRWWHQIDLPDGSVTPGRDRSAEKLASLHLPDLSGKTVLDVGAYDGYFSFAAERLGASRVLAVDTHVWRRPGGKDGFEYARNALGSGVEDVELEVLDVSPETVGKWDVVLFLGVLYHMRHPFLALERMASVTDELLVVETLMDMTFLRSPSAAFYPWKTSNDDTKWWGPNRAAVLGMIRSVGFDRVVPYPVKRYTGAWLRGLPDRAKTSADLMSSTPRGSRQRLIRDLARSLTTQNRLVAHGLRSQP
jgi:tRNA (mo5U34)-methyltransferase